MFLFTFYFTFFLQVNELKQLDISTIDSFTIHPIHPNTVEWSSIIDGQLKSDDRNVLFKINNGFDQLLKLIDTCLFDINFTSNRITYQIQHKALKWVGEHELYNILIGNPLYLCFDDRGPSNSKYEFQ